jgi:hypothetical protein
LQEIHTRQDEEIKQKTEMFAINSRQRINNLSNNIVYGFGRRTLPQYIRIPASWYGYKDESWERYYIPNQQKMIKAPLKEGKLFRLRYQIPDFNKSTNVEIEDWLRTSLLVVEMINHLPTTSRLKIKNDPKYSL